MKSKSTHRHLLALAASSLMVVCSASAQSLHWDANGDTAGTGGTGTWNDPGTWRSGSGTGTLGSWTDGSFANFLGTAGTVTLTSPVSATGIWMQATGYSIVGSTITLTGSPSITTQNNGSISSTISGTNGLTKAGGSSLTLSGNNDYTGITTVSAGILTVSHNNALGSSAAGSNNTTIAATGSSSNRRIQVSNGISIAENITITGTTEANQYVGAIYTPGTATLSGTITLAGSGAIRLGGGNTSHTASTINWTGTITQSSTSHTLLLIGNNVVSNPMAINGANLTIANSGTAGTRLDAVNGTGIGDTDIYDATLKLGIADAIRTDRDLTFSSSAGINSRFDLNGYDQTIRGLINSGGGTREVYNNASLTTSTLTVGNGGGDYSFGGRILNAVSGNGIVALVKTGTGNQTLTGINTFTGGTRIDDGTLTLSNATDTLANTGAVNVNGGILSIGGNSDTVGAVTLTSGSITGTGGTLTGSSYDVRGGSVSAILGGSGALTKSTAGTVTLSGANTYTGATTITEGTLKLGANDVLPDVSAVSIDTATLDADTLTDTVGTLDVTGSGVINLGTGAALVFADSSAGGTGTWAGTLNITGTLGATSLKFGNSSSGLSSAQLSKISVNGSGLGTYTLDASGYLIPGGPDTIAPTLVSITDDKSGGPVTAGTQVTYTVTFSEDIATTLTTGDFNNEGSAPLTINSVAETAPTSGVFTVVATPTGPGNLKLRIPTGTLVEDTSGNDLVVPVSDATTITVNPSDPYLAWAGPGVLFDADANGDGLDNGLAFLLGASGPNVNATGLLPTTSQTGGNLVMNFTCLATAERGTATLNLEYDGDLVGTWLSVPVPGAVGAPNPIVENTATGSVSFTATDGGTNGNGDALIDVEATINDTTESSSGKLFGRLKGVNP